MLTRLRISSERSTTLETKSLPIKKQIKNGVEVVLFHFVLRHSYKVHRVILTE